MSSVKTAVSFKCSRCGAVYQADAYRLIDCGADPGLRAKVTGGEVFIDRKSVV